MPYRLQAKYDAIQFADRKCPFGVACNIADNLSKAGWSWGCVSAVDSDGRTIWIVDPHRDNGKRFVARAEEKLTAFVELEAAIRAAASCLTFSDRYVRLNSHARGTPSRRIGTTNRGDT